MANQRHVDILLRDGVRVWNLWRKEEPGIRPDLSRANFEKADLTGADLTGADLTGADLTGAVLEEAKLVGADRHEPDLVEVDLDDGRDRYEADFSEANLSGADLRGAFLNWSNLSGANLSGANLSGTHLNWADLDLAHLNWADLSDANLGGDGVGEGGIEVVGFRGAHLLEAKLRNAMLDGVDFSGADLSGAHLIEVHFSSASLSKADLKGANLGAADLSYANLTGADLTRADLSYADLTGANLSYANLSYANLSETRCLRTDFTGATLTDCIVYGVSAWDVKLDGAKQADLRITPEDADTNIRVDNLEVAQFLYVLLTNPKVRNVLDTITSKVVLILGRFSEERKPVLDAIREALRNHPNGYIPVLFDFEPQQDRPVLETVKTLANLARFIIADLTDPRMVRSELTYIIPNVPTVPVQPIMQSDGDLSPEYRTWVLYKSFLPVYRYADREQLLANLTEAVIAPVEQHVVARRLADADSH